MAYTVIPAGDIVAGKPTKEEIFDQTRTNQEDFDTRITALEQTSQIDMFDIKYTGSVGQYTQAELESLAPTFKSPVSATVTSFVVTLLESSTSGTLEMHLDKSTDNGVNWTPMTSSTVDLTGTTIGSISGSVVWSDDTVAQNNLLRIRITGIQVGQGAFHVSIYGEVS